MRKAPVAGKAGGDEKRPQTRPRRSRGRDVHRRRNRYQTRLSVRAARSEIHQQERSRENPWTQRARPKAKAKAAEKPSDAHVQPSAIGQ